MSIIPQVIHKEPEIEMELDWIWRGPDPPRFESYKRKDKRNLATHRIVGDRYQGKSALGEFIMSKYLKNGSTGYDFFAANDNESLAWLNPNSPYKNKVVLVHGDTIRLSCNFQTIKMSDLDPVSNPGEKLFITCKKFYSSEKEHYQGLFNFTSRVSERDVWDRIDVMFIREAQQYISSRMKTNQAKNQKEAAEKFIEFHNEAFHSGMTCIIDCFDEETEILEKTQGWIKVSQMSQGMEFATLDPETREMSYKPATNIYSYDYNGPMIHFGGKQSPIDILVTPNHKMLVKDGWSQEAKSVTASDLIAKGSRNKTAHLKDKWIRSLEIFKGIPLTHIELPPSKPMHEITIDRNGKELSSIQLQRTKLLKIPIDNYLSLLGWYIAEGSLVKNGIEISRNPKDENEKVTIQNVINKAGFHATPTSHSVIVNSRQLREHFKPLGYSTEKYIPGWIRMLNPDKLQIFLQSYISGDGHRVKNSNGTEYFECSTASRRLADNLQEIGIKCGFAVTLRPNKAHDSFCRGRLVKGGPWYQLTFSGRTEPEINYRIIKTVSYSGKIYCPEVPPFHNVLIRRNGKAVWIGQSQREVEVSKNLRELGTFTYYKNMGAMEIPRKIWWLGHPKLAHFDLDSLRTIDESQFLLMTNKNCAARGRFDEPPWHIDRGAGLLSKLGISISRVDGKKIENAPVFEDRTKVGRKSLISEEQEIVIQTLVDQGKKTPEIYVQLAKFNGFVGSQRTLRDHIKDMKLRREIEAEN